MAEEDFEVEKILATKQLRRKTLYKVRWRSFGPEQDTWEPASHLMECKDLLEEFRAKEKAERSALQPNPKVIKNAKVVVEESAKIFDMNFTDGFSVEFYNSRMTVDEGGDGRDDKLLRRSTLRGQHRTDATPKTTLNSPGKPAKMETMEDDAVSEDEDGATSPFIVFLCIFLIILVILFISFTSN